MSKIEPMMKKPSLFRRTLMGFVSGWRRVMDIRYNPLKYIPDPSLQTYFMLVLLYMFVYYYQWPLQMQSLLMQRETDINGWKNGKTNKIDIL